MTLAHLNASIFSTIPRGGKRVGPDVVADLLVCAGGASGGPARGAGGGAGGMINNTNVTLAGGTAFTVTVGAGGAAVTNTGFQGNNGSNSVLSGTGLTTLTAIGGGGGGNALATSNDGLNGGSGGGATRSGSVGTATATQGNNGGTGAQAGSQDAGGGGGGADVDTGFPEAAVAYSGFPADSAYGGYGGAAKQASWGAVTLNSVSNKYAGGGGGGAYKATTASGEGQARPGNNGSGNGGQYDARRQSLGQANPVIAATAASANTAGGGGGGGGNSLGGINANIGAAGGSGIVVIRYSGVQTASGGTVTSTGGYTYHTFLSSGTFTTA